jgi:SmpA / OmlA family
MNRRAPVGVLVAALLVVGAPANGCLAVGRNFVSTPVSGMAKGITTKADVEQLFGEPFRRGIDDGYDSWSYVYNRWSLFSEARSKDLYIVFNKDGTVRSYTFNSNFD